MKKKNKYIYGWALYVNYGAGTGWEYEVFEYTASEMRSRIKEYRENCPQYPVKCGRRRELNTESAEAAK